MYTAIGTYYSFLVTVCLPGGVGTQTGKQTVIQKATISTNCCIHTVVPPDDRPRYARNMQRLTKCTENKFASSWFSITQEL
jgi:hypothetical protein